MTFNLINSFRLNRIFLNYGRIAKVRPPSRNIIQSSGNPFIMRSCPLQKIAFYKPRSRSFNGIAGSTPFDSQFHMSFNLNDLEIVYNNKPIPPNIPPLILTAEPPTPKAPSPPQSTPTSNEPASSSTPNIPGNNTETAVTAICISLFHSCRLNPKSPRKAFGLRRRRKYFTITTDFGFSVLKYELPPLCVIDF